MAQRRLNGAARQIMSDLMHARMGAVSQNNEFKVSFPNNHEYQILDDDDNDGSADTGEVLQTKNIQTDYHDVTFSSTGNPIFYSRGTAYGATITVANTAGSKNISVAVTGRVVIGS
ncbi:MAG TPA: GspH/FimT family protein [Bacteroidales bacterium]|nr:GspH/FimT family protein [Bacteroidales bacterium]